jgi:hypothetical protein
LNLSYGASYIDPNLVSQIIPRAGVPRWEKVKRFGIASEQVVTMQK